MKNGPYELIVAPDGYPGYLYRDRYAYEHRIVWWKERGELPDGVIHHKNGDKRDNRIENLEKIPREEHSKIHADSQKTRYLHFICPVCLQDETKQYKQTHLGKGKEERGYQTCSRSCGSKSIYMDEEELRENFEIVEDYYE